MKLIKLMLAIVMALAMVVAQDTGGNPCDPNMTYPAADPGPDGGCGNYADCNGNGAFDLGEPCFENQGPPPCDEWLNSDMAHDMNGDGTVDEGDCPGQGPPPFEDVDTNGDGSIDRDEARDFFGDEPNFDEEYDKVDTNGDGMVDHAEYMASDGGDHEGGDGYDGPPPFEDVDTNGDGSVDRDEARDFFGDEPNFDEEYDKIDTNGDGMVDHAEYMASDGGDHEGGDGYDGPPPFEDVDTNDDGAIDRDEARDFFGDEPNFDEEYDKVDTNGDGVVDHAEYMASDGGDHDGGGTCDVCGHEYGGPDDHHGHCRVCGAEMNTDDDWNAHCNENWEHCKPQAGDTCGYVGPSGDECGYVHSGDPDEDHHHCDHCGLGVNSGEEMHNHMQADHPDMMGQHDDGGGDHDGQQHFPNNHWDGNCGAMMNGQSEYWLDSDGDPDNGPEDGPYAVWHEDADGNPVNCGGPGGPPPTCEEVDANGDGSIDRDEARAKFGHDPQGNPDPNFDQRYDEVDTNGDGVVDCDEHDAAVAEGENNN